MLTFTFGLGLGCTAVLLAAVYREYHHVPTLELKRRARQGDEVAAALYRVAAYGLSVKTLLIGLGVASLYGCLYFLEEATPQWAAGLIFTVVCGLCAWVLSAKSSSVSLKVAAATAPFFARITERFDPLFSRVGRIFSRFQPVSVHTGLYSKADLQQLFDRLKRQKDSSISPVDIDLVSHALSFGDKLVSEVMTPKRVVSAVQANDTVAPILVSELHKTGHSRFPVYKGKDEEVIGVLYLHDITAHMDSRPVHERMRTQVRYVHEEYSLRQTLQAFLKTKQHLFVVVNEFEEYVGIITIEDILEQVIGKPIVDEFDEYEDLRAVAASAARKEHIAHENSMSKPNEVKPTPDK